MAGITQPMAFDWGSAFSNVVMVAIVVVVSPLQSRLPRAPCVYCFCMNYILNNSYQVLEALELLHLGTVSRVRVSVMVMVIDVLVPFLYLPVSCVFTHLSPVICLSLPFVLPTMSFVLLLQ